MYFLHIWRNLLKVILSLISRFITHFWLSMLKAILKETPALKARHYGDDLFFQWNAILSCICPVGCPVFFPHSFLVSTLISDFPINAANCTLFFILMEKKIELLSGERIWS